MHRDSVNVEHEILKCTIIPVIIGTSEIMAAVLKKNLEAVPVKQLVDSLQKAAILGTSHRTRKVLQCETGSLSGRNCRWFRRRSAREKRPAIGDKIIIIIIIIIIICRLTNACNRD
jgi:hypothetical protein